MEKAPTKAPCKEACPAGVDVPRYLRFIAAGKYAEAVAVIRESIPFPAVCGYVCPAPCELKCQLAGASRRPGGHQDPQTLCRRQCLPGVARRSPDSPHRQARRDRGRGTGRPDGGLLPGRAGASAHRLRGAARGGRDDADGDPGLPAPPERPRRRYRGDQESRRSR